MEATFRESRNSVTISKSEGNEERSNGFRMYMPTSRIISANVILKANSKSSSMAGMGMTMTVRIIMAVNPMKTSVLLAKKAKRPR